VGNEIFSGTFSLLFHSTEEREAKMKFKIAERTADSTDDFDLAKRVSIGDDAAFRTIIERHNRRLYRIARSILCNDSEAEDIVQATYLKAYLHIKDFRGEAGLATWLARITINEALELLRRQRPTVPLEKLNPEPNAEILSFPQMSDNPERITAQRQIMQRVEQAIDNIPKDFRIVFMTRVIEGMSVEETAAILDLKPETVKTRLHRARLSLREQLDQQVGPLFTEAFPFAGKRCERLAHAVLQQLGLDHGTSSKP